MLTADELNAIRARTEAGTYGYEGLRRDALDLLAHIEDMADDLSMYEHCRMEVLAAFSGPNAYDEHGEMKAFGSLWDSERIRLLIAEQVNENARLRAGLVDLRAFLISGEIVSVFNLLGTVERILEPSIEAGP